MIQERIPTSNKQLASPLEIIKLSRNGFPKQAADILSKRIDLTDKEMSKILNVSERTYHRYNSDTVFDTATSEKLLQLTALYTKGEDVFDSLENFKIWMRHPHVLFEMKTPLELLDTNTGFRLVEDELGRIEYGVYI
jgi:putative toxin-antitoxin system antitoxin component (TIGR02293 family)